MNLLWTSRSWTHYLYWQEEDAAIVERINALLADAMRHPFEGIGKPEPLRGNLKGWWSRRINAEHRLIYRCIGSKDDKRLEVSQCRYHY